MLLDTFETQGLLYNSNFKDDAGAGLQAYRGDLVLIEGEVADNLGRRKPPKATMVGAVLLADETQLKFVAGSVDEIAYLADFIAGFQAHFAPGMGALLFVVDIPKPLRVEAAGVSFSLLPLAKGLVWNELLDELRLDKSDFKGMSSSAKVVTLYQAQQGYQPRGEAVTLETAMSLATGARREFHGAI